MAFLIPEAYLQSLNSRTLSLFTSAAQNLHQWSECHAMSFGQDDVWTNPVNRMPRADPEEGAGVRTPAPWKSQFYRFIYKYAIGPLPLRKVGSPGNVGPSFSIEYWKVTV